MVLPRYSSRVAQVIGAKEADKILQDYVNGLDRITSENFQELGKNIVVAASSRTPIDTGRLVSNNKILAADSKKLIVGNPTPYAKHVHDGTSRMPARPFFLAPIQIAKERFPNLMVKDCASFYKELQQKHQPK